MAAGVVARVDGHGNGAIAPASRGELVRYNGYRALDLRVGDRVWFLAEVTTHGVVVTKLRRDQRKAASTG